VQDALLEADLRADEKERAEHAMLVDLARNDVARVSRAGTTVVERPFVVEAQRHVLHLVSSVRGRRRPGLDALHVWRAVANMGTLTGAPKVRAMELLRAIEPIGRGSYGGAVGMLDGDGAFRSCIAIRGVRLRGGRALARAGAGIVRASVPELELAETEQKLASAREAVALANARAGGREGERAGGRAGEREGGAS